MTERSAAVLLMAGMVWSGCKGKSDGTASKPVDDPASAVVPTADTPPAPSPIEVDVSPPPPPECTAQIKELEAWLASPTDPGTEGADPALVKALEDFQAAPDPAQRLAPLTVGAKDDGPFGMCSAIFRSSLQQVADVPPARRFDAARAAYAEAFRSCYCSVPLPTVKLHAWALVFSGEQPGE